MEKTWPRGFRHPLTRKSVAQFGMACHWMSRPAGLGSLEFRTFGCRPRATALWGGSLENFKICCFVLRFRRTCGLCTAEVFDEGGPASAEDVWLSDRYRREVCPVRESGDLPTAIGARLVPHGAGSDRYRREVLSPLRASCADSWFCFKDPGYPCFTRLSNSRTQEIRLRREID